MHLRELELSETPDVLELIKESGLGEQGFSLTEKEITDYDAYFLARKNESLGVDLKANRVPQTVYWIYDESQLVGVIKVRKGITPALLKHGGNIGYYIKKDFRNRGYGTKALKLALKILHDIQIPKALITCNSDNIGSEKVILNNGGILEDIKDNTKRFWLTTDIS